MEYSFKEINPIYIICHVQFLSWSAVTDEIDNVKFGELHETVVTLD
jgi:hypothetical protein